MITKVDKCLPKKYISDIEDIVKDLPMYYSINTSYAPEDKHFNFWNSQLTQSNIVDNGQFTHAVFHKGEIFSKYYGLLYPILYMFADKAGYTVNEITRIKVNLLLQDKTFTSENYNFPHSDRDGKYAFLYYVNDCDGDTIFFNEFDNLKTIPNNFTVCEKTNPSKGSGVFFESIRFHASCNPCISQYRYVINFNFN
jgi:hypothetical protein